MLKIFKGKQKLKEEDFTKHRPHREDLSWPLLTALKIRLNPFTGRVFFHLVICMTAKMAVVDGAVSEIELKLFTELLEREFALNRKQMNRARVILFEAHKSKRDFSYFANEFYRYFKKHPAVLHNALDVLLAMAYADNQFSLSEQRLMAEAAEIFHVSSEELNRLVKRYHKRTSKVERYTGTTSHTHRAQQEQQKQSAHHYQKSSGAEKEDQQGKKDRSGAEQHASTLSEPSRQWFEILGCTPFDTPRLVKKRYRELVREFHPDALPPGIPEEMKRASSERFLDIQRAYEHYTIHVLK